MTTRSHLPSALCLALLSNGCVVDAASDDTGEHDTSDTADSGDTDPPAASHVVDGITVQRLTADDALPACDDGLLAGLFEDLDSWQHARACAFASAGLSSVGETTTFTLHLTVPSDDALTVGETFQVTWDPNAGIAQDEVAGWLKVQQGSDLFAPFCNDVLENPPVVNRTWTPIDGFMRMEVTAATGDWEPWGAPFTARVEVRGVVLQADDSASTCGVPDLDLSDLNMGWLPG